MSCSVCWAPKTPTNYTITCNVCKVEVGCVNCAENIHFCVACEAPLCEDHAMLCKEPNGKLAYVCADGCVET